MIPSIFASDSPAAGAGQMVEITVTLKNTNDGYYGKTLYDSAKKAKSNLRCVNKI